MAPRSTPQASVELGDGLMGDYGVDAILEAEDQDRLKEHEAAVFRHWHAFLAACKREGMDEVTFLSSLGANVGNLLLEHPEHAGPWLERLGRQVRGELHLRVQEPS